MKAEKRTLHLTLERKWFDLIASGEKREEYRKIKPYWNKRLNKSFDVIQFRNGYQVDAPAMVVELNEVMTGLGIIEWGAPEYEKVYILKLGKIIELKNYES